MSVDPSQLNAQPKAPTPYRSPVSASRRLRLGVQLFFAVVFLLIVSGRLQATDDVPQSFFDVHCCDCHNAVEANADIRLDDAHLRDWSEPETSAFFERVSKAVGDGRMPPDEAMQPGDDERNAAAESLHASLLQHSPTGGTLLRRLSRLEYENTIQKIFGIDFHVPPGFPNDHPNHGFDNTADGLVVSAPLMEAYFHSAISVADQIIPPPRKPVPSVQTKIAASDLVISYSSGAIIDGAMRLAAKTDQMWRSATWPEKFEVQTAGTYRIAVSASSFAPPSNAWPQYNEPMKLQIRARSLNGKDGDAVTKQRLLAEFDVRQDSPESFECIAELFPAETPVFYFANAPLAGDQAGKKSFGKLLRKMFDNDPRLLAGWLEVKHASGLRGGLGWDRVKTIRDSEQLDLADVDRSDEAIDKLIKKMTKNPNLYVETVIYQFFEEGPALQIHEVNIDGPCDVIETPDEKRQKENANRFLGTRGDQSDREYVRSFMRQFLTRAFRRPASDADVDEYTAMVLDHVERGNPLDDGLHLAIRTALMSPKFLYRGHRPGRLDDFDLATRLAYFLTAGPPDTELTEAASSGELSNPVKLEEHARRLLKTPEHNTFGSDFTGQWLGTRNIDEIMPDERLVPKFTPEHRDAMIRETELFFEEVLQKNLPLETFIKPEFTFLNEPLAKAIYGRDDVKTKGQRFARVSIPPDSPYGGLLGQASVMMATANGVDTQPVVRGVWVLENILGDPPPPPPDDVPALTPDTQDAETVRDLLAAHRSETSCATCHRRIDPLGYVLENFDPVGRWRTHYPVYSSDEKGKPVVMEGEAIDARGEFPGGGEFRNIDDLKRHVVDNIEAFGNCLSQQLLTYATGRPLTYSEKHEIQEIVTATLRRGDGFQDLLIALIQSDAFGTK